MRASSAQLRDFDTMRHEHVLRRFPIQTPHPMSKKETTNANKCKTNKSRTLIYKTTSAGCVILNTAVAT